MREISFRAKTEEGNWVYGDLDTTDTSCIRIVQRENPPTKTRCFIAHIVSPKTICQYIMTTEDGINIYEKDVLLQWGEPYVVEWKIWDDQQGYNIAMDDWDLEVIGNIIDTPDILKKYEK